MTERYFSAISVKRKYEVTEKKIIRSEQNFKMLFGFTDEYYNYIRNTCIRIYPTREIVFVGYLKKVYNSIFMDEAKCSVDAFNMGVSR